ncbi:MAG TPA: gliding motility protein GldC [Cytophagaceae bacterium]|jgi:gliding motility-associated protein GldC|nr:gliding motility protein GldC [Cytophagaceae bacterium]
MKKSEINFSIELDANNIPEKIFWEATDNPNGRKEETKAIALAIWDQEQHASLRMDLWAKDMPVDDMKLFYLETIGGMADSLLTSTGDEVMANGMKELVKKLLKHLEENQKGK